MEYHIFMYLLYIFKHHGRPFVRLMPTEYRWQKYKKVILKKLSKLGNYRKVDSHTEKIF